VLHRAGAQGTWPFVDMTTRAGKLQSFIASEVILTSFWLVAYVDWKVRHLVRRPKLLTFGCVLGSALIVAAYLSLICALSLYWCATSSRTTASTALVLEEACYQVLCICYEHIVPTMFYVVAVVAVAGVEVHGDIMAAFL
jgi:hypothetical protein